MNIKATIHVVSHRELPLYLSLSLLYSSTGSLLPSRRQGGDWRKKASLNPIPNPQQALKHRDSGGPAAAALSLYSSLFCSSDRGSEEELVFGKSRKRHQQRLPCSARSAPWRAESHCQRTLVAIASTTCVWWEVFLALLRLTGCCVVE